jgi:hypothetical protein
LQPFGEESTCAAETTDNPSVAAIATTRIRILRVRGIDWAFTVTF